MNLRDAKSSFCVDALFYWLFKRVMLFVIRADWKEGFPFHRRCQVFSSVSAQQNHCTDGDLGHAFLLLCRPQVGTPF